MNTTAAPTSPPGSFGLCTPEAVKTIFPCEVNTSGRRRCSRRTCPRWFVPTVSSKPSLVRKQPEECWTPALQAIMSIFFFFFFNSSAKDSMEERFARSKARISMFSRPWEMGIDWTALLARLTFLAARMMLKLFVTANCFTAAKPMPRLPPVMSTVFFCAHI